MSTGAESNLNIASVPDASHYLVAQVSINKRSMEQPKVKGEDDEHYKRMPNNLAHLWSGSKGVAYDEVGNAILEQWFDSGPPDKNFIEKAVDVLIEFQKRPMKSMKDSLEWLEHLKKSEIDSKKYFAWVDEQYEFLAREKRKGIDDISLERFSSSLLTANWRDANDDSAIVNAYLLNTETSLCPEIHLGSLGCSPLAVRVNSECSRTQKADFHTAESHGVTAINPDILLDMRIVPLGPGESKQTLLFVPIGNVFRMPLSQHSLHITIFEEDDWQDTGIILVLGISRTTGMPETLYMAKHLRPPNTEVGEDDKALWESLETDPFTLAQVENMTHVHLMPYNGILERPTLRLKRLSVSKLEIVQTGEKGDWSADVPPVGLYPTN